MSSPLALAAVTTTLRDLLNTGLVDHDVAANIGSFKVTALPPDRIETGAQESNQLNLFLYAVSPNAAWRNQDLPALNGRGDARLTTPPLALDLHYLLSAYAQDDLACEILLGYGMFILHQTPVLTRAAIRTALVDNAPAAPNLAPNPADGWTVADLADQFEQVRLSPHTMSSEEIGKLWTAMQARFRPSAAYVASVVLIQAVAPTPAPLPVRKPVVTVSTWRRPFISAVEPQVVSAGGMLSIRGSSLKGAKTVVEIGALALPVAPVGDERIEVAPPAALPAGIHPLQVRHEIELTGATTPHPGVGFESNVVAFVLAPRITTPAPINASAGGTLTLAVTPPVASDQRVLLLLGDRAIPLAARSTGSPPASSLLFDLPDDLASGVSLLRVQVDGAQSALEVDTNPASPTFGEYSGPRVTIA